MYVFGHLVGLNILPPSIKSTKIDRIFEIYTNVSRKMDSVFETYLRPDGGALLAAEPDDIPKINTSVWILGKCYNSINGNQITHIKY